MMGMAQSHPMGACYPVVQWEDGCGPQAWTTSAAYCAFSGPIMLCRTCAGMQAHALWVHCSSCSRHAQHCTPRQSFRCFVQRLVSKISCQTLDRVLTTRRPFSGNTFSTASWSASSRGACTAPRDCRNVWARPRASAPISSVRSCVSAC
jgi:hypothetical protein